MAAALAALLACGAARAQAPAGAPLVQLHDTALAMLGMEYGYGRNDEEAVDCSALMQRIFASAGVALPRTVRGLLHTGAAVSPADARAGDLLIYRWRPRQLHVALYLERDRIVHASPSAGEVVVTALTPDWRRHLVAIRRVLG